MIFSNSNSKRTDSDFSGAVLTTLESLQYLTKRVSSVYEKTPPNPSLLKAINCLDTMRDGIQVAAVCEPTQALHRA